MSALSMFKLEGRIALVSGASRGIGAAVARTLAEQGAQVILSSRRPEDCEAVAAAIRNQGGKALARRCHAGSLAEVEEMIHFIGEEFGHLDILVNNAATNPHFGLSGDLSPAAFDKTMEVNFRGPFFLSARAVKLMQKRGGAIVNVSSIAALTPGIGQGLYGCTKAAMVHMTRVFASEYGHHGIRVNALLPGLTDTRIMAVFKKNPELLQQQLAQQPIPRMAQPDEMAAAVLFLVSDASSYMTGQTLVMDGGALLATGRAWSQPQDAGHSSTPESQEE